MPSIAIEAKTIIFERSGVVYLSRTHGPDGALITQAAIDTIEYAVHDVDAHEAAAEAGQPAPVAVDSGSVDKTTSVFDTLQTDDDRWTVDEEGFNFVHPLPPEAFPEGKTNYQVEYVFNPVNGNSWRQRARVRTGEMYEP